VAFPVTSSYRRAWRHWRPTPAHRPCARGGTVLFLVAAQEGVGFHSLRDKWLLNRGRAVPRPWRMVVYAPQISPVEALASLPPDSKVFDDIDEAVAMVASLHAEASANVFPHGR